VRCDILIRSYQRDFGWLAQCLRSIERFCEGFRDVVVVVPRSSHERLSRLRLPLDPRTLSCPDYRQDYLGQQVTKLHADLYTDADYVCHVDSDCVFRRLTRPEDLLADGRPRVNMAPYAVLDRYLPWRDATERFLGLPVAYEFMRTPPYTFPRWLYQSVRDHAIARHGRSVTQYVLAQEPRGFSEFNALAAYGFWRNRAAFDWCDVSQVATPEPSCRVYWSWAGLDPTTLGEIDALLA
jgi:hypothetical protein